MKTLREYALSFLGTPYVYGGNSHLAIDCSGLVCELMKSCGILPGKTDLNAIGLFDFFMEFGDPSDCSFGAIAFFGRRVEIPHTETLINHVGFCIDSFRMIEAAGGNSFVDSVTKAYSIGACVKMNPVNRRNDLIGILKPRYALHGIE